MNGTVWDHIRYDAVMLLASIGLFVAYHVFLVVMGRRDRNYSFQLVMARSRAAWIHAVMEQGKDILAVQTLRNSTMAATFLASTAIFLITGVLTLSSQGDKLESLWHALNVTGGGGPEVWLLKILAMLVDLFGAFLSFTMAIRMFHHVGYMINVPLTTIHGRVPPKLVIAQLNRAGHFYWFGMRTYFFLVPLVLWLFGPDLMIGSTVVLVAVLYRLDHMRAYDDVGAEPAERPEGKLIALR
ncbi:MAG: DUF599 domain-containing protein [Solirubrobacterales bacterium]